MKIIIAGSRNITDYNVVIKAIKESEFNITEVISGGAKGVDSLGELYALRNNIPVKLFSADWNKFGKSAGPKRNLLMAKYAEGLIAVWNTESKGTFNMIATAMRNKIKVFVFNTTVSRGHYAN